MRPTPLIASLILFVALVVGARAHGSGLLAPTDQTLPPLRVTDHLVDVSVHDGVAITSVEQTFRNDTNRRLEATYVFPLPEEGDLTDFQMSFNGKMVKGEVLPADQARQIYESIVRQTRDPGLIEFIGRRLLRMRVFPIEPGSDTVVQLRYQQVCRPISGMLGFHYPLRTPKTEGRAYGTVRFNVALETSAALKNVWSPSHSVEVVRDGEHRAKVAYEAVNRSLEDDFLLLYSTDSSDVGLSTVAFKPNESDAGHFVMMLTPRHLWPEEDEQPQDVVFVLDTSGSMAEGGKLEQARRSLRYCVDRLDEKDRFSVVRFSTGFDVLYDELRPATEDARTKAREWIASFKPAGGTNIADTLQHVLSMRPGADEARPFLVVFLTDGQGNRQPPEIMKMLSRADGARVRVFPFGVGHDVNTKLLDQLASAYQGRPTYVQPGEDLELVLGDFFSVISRPVLTDLRLTLPGIDATERFPATLGDLYHGQQLVLAGRFGTAATGPVKLTASRNGERVEYTWPAVAFTHTAEAEYVPAIWAGRKIAFLVDQIRTHGESPEMLTEVVALSQQYGIQTPYTSWLVNPEGLLVARQRGVQLPRSGTRRFGGAGGGGEGDPQALSEQRQVLRRAAPSAGAVVADRAGEDLFLFETLSAEAAADGVVLSAGRAATIIAGKNAEMREMKSLDDSRVDAARLVRQLVDGLWYNRIGGYLVDESVDEKTDITVVRFGSEAYFEIVRNRPALRGVLARDRHVVVMLSEGRAVLVADEEGLESLSTELRESFGLTSR